MLLISLVKQADDVRSEVKADIVVSLVGLRSTLIKYGFNKSIGIEVSSDLGYKQTHNILQIFYYIYRLS
jgi:hypothetical protein